jgi:hypothetical protein
VDISYSVKKILQMCINYKRKVVSAKDGRSSSHDAALEKALYATVMK